MMYRTNWLLSSLGFLALSYFYLGENTPLFIKIDLVLMFFLCLCLVVYYLIRRQYEEIKKFWSGDKRVSLWIVTVWMILAFLPSFTPDLPEYEMSIAMFIISQLTLFIGVVLPERKEDSLESS